jgi:hypothetical protein
VEYAELCEYITTAAAITKQMQAYANQNIMIHAFPWCRLNATIRYTKPIGPEAAGLDLSPPILKDMHVWLIME